MLPAATIEALKTMKRGDPDDLIFTDSGGGFVRRSNFDRRVHRPLVARAGIPHRTVHEMRHTHASLLLAEGQSIRLISTRLGHADIATTLRLYAHLMLNAEAHAADRLDELFTRVPDVPEPSQPGAPPG